MRAGQSAVVARRKPLGCGAAHTSAHDSRFAHDSRKLPASACRQDEDGEMVYTWEEGMDEAYRASNLKAFKKLLDTPRCACGG